MVSVSFSVWRRPQRLTEPLPKVLPMVSVSPMFSFELRDHPVNQWAELASNPRLVTFEPGPFP